MQSLSVKKNHHFTYRYDIQIDTCDLRALTKLTNLNAFSDKILIKADIDKMLLKSLRI